MPRKNWLFVGCILFVAVGLIGCGKGSDKEKDKENDPKDVAAEADKKPESDPEFEKPARPPRTPGGSGGDQQTISFLGSQGKGRRFCIIADCTKSLSIASFSLIKKEIANTVATLKEPSEVHVMFFADKPYPMPGGGWLSGKKAMEVLPPWLDAQGLVLKTLPLPAFKAALELDPRPDVIFFMTDGQLRPKDVGSQISALNTGEPRVTIHSILFTRTSEVASPENPARATLETLAKENGGTFTQFIDPDVLPKEEKKKKKKKI